MALRIRITGLVQGVGFRPNVWRLAQACGISGTVRNDSSGVLIEAWGADISLASFQQQLRTDIPPLARVDSIQVEMLETACPHDSFRIIASESGEIHTGIAPDATMCPECRADIFDPANRRYRYPFTNCTHCGPRLSIVCGIPYDRANTSMSAFTLCPECQREYTNPADRRFHAQPNACPACGPHVWLESMAGERIDPNNEERDCLDTASRLLREGKVLALMGLGGVHLACDATNEAAIAELRRRKRRYQKPLALMARDLDVIRRYCRASEAEAALLQSKHAPIVLFEEPPPSLSLSGEEQERRHTSWLPSLIRGGVGRGFLLGFMLPYTPLHALLLEAWETPLVMTSANLSEEPQCTSVEETRQRMRGIADYLLLHDRPILNRVDDSVTRVLAGKPRLLRRARGYAPEPINLPSGFENTPPLLALGGELKNTFALVRDNQAILSQHLGDLEDPRTWREYQQTLNLYLKLFTLYPPQAGSEGNSSRTAVLSERSEFHKVLEELPSLPASAIIVDKHPAYRSTQLGTRLAKAHHLPLLEIQHHHAHAAACMAENHWPLDGGKVLGIILDGLGYGEDGSLWGGEFLLADYHGCKRLAHFKPTPMPGGTQAILQPWRNTWAHLHQLGWQEISRIFPNLEVVQFLQSQPMKTLETMLERDLNSPLSSSCGRLFDAVAAALGFSREQISYEGQAAIELEAATSPALLRLVPPYPFELERNGQGLWEIDPAPMWCELLKDLQAGYPREAISAHFHQGMIHILAETAEKLCAAHPEIRAVALSGGVFQNALLFTGLVEKLQTLKIPILTHSQVPSNDGGLALGQAAIAGARMQQKGNCTC